MEVGGPDNVIINDSSSPPFQVLMTMQQCTCLISGEGEGLAVWTSAIDSAGSHCKGVHGVGLEGGQRIHITGAEGEGGLLAAGEAGEEEREGEDLSVPLRQEGLGYVEGDRGGSGAGDSDASRRTTGNYKMVTD